MLALAYLTAVAATACADLGFGVDVDSGGPYPAYYYGPDYYGGGPWGDVYYPTYSPGPPPLVGNGPGSVFFPDYTPLRPPSHVRPPMTPPVNNGGGGGGSIPSGRPVFPSAPGGIERPGNNGQAPSVAPPENGGGSRRGR